MKIAAEDDNITLVDPTKSLYAKNKLDSFSKMVYTLKGNYVIANEILKV